MLVLVEVNCWIMVDTLGRLLILIFELVVRSFMLWVLEKAIVSLEMVSLGRFL